MSDLIGLTIDRYQILEQLGQGGMATVYLGYDSRLDRKVAIKVIRRDTFPPVMLEKILKRFEREAKALARLNHPNIVGVIDYGNFNGSPYLVMPFIPSGTLKEKLGKPIHYAEAARILVPITRALAYAHAEDIIHRDVKPSNILITRSGEPVLTDFGIAKILEEVDGNTLTSTGMGLGTPEYMAPEQWYGKADACSDQYALGVIFYEMVTGQKPYTADTPPAVMLKQATEPLPPPGSYIQDLPEDVEITMQRMLEKNAEKRFSNLKALVKILDRMAHDTQELSALVTEEIIFPEEEVDLETEFGMVNNITENQIKPDEQNSTPGSEPVLIIDDQNQTDFNEERIDDEDHQSSKIELEQQGNSDELDGITQDALTGDFVETLSFPQKDEFSDEEINKEGQKENIPLIDKDVIHPEYFSDQPSSTKIDDRLLKAEESEAEIIPEKSSLQNLFRKGRLINKKWIVLTATITVIFALFFILSFGKTFSSPVDKTPELETEQSPIPMITETSLPIIVPTIQKTKTKPVIEISPTPEISPTQFITIQPTPTKMLEALSSENIKFLQAQTTLYNGDSFDISTDGKFIAVVVDNELKIYDLSSGEEYESFRNEMNITNIRFSPNNSSIAFASEDGFIYILNIDNGEIIYKFEGCTYCSSALSFSNDSAYLAATYKETDSVMIWNLSDGTQKYPISANSYSIHSLDFSPTEMYLAAIYSYVDSSNPQYTGNIMTYPVIRFARIWNINTGRIILNIQLPKYGVNCFDFSPDGSMLAGGSSNETITIWKVSNSYTLHEIHGQKDIIRSVQFSPDGSLLFSGSHNGSLFIWNANDGELLSSFDDLNSYALRTIRFIPDGTKVYLGYEDGTIINMQIDRAN